jgi:hypothetical protein
MARGHRKKNEDALLSALACGATAEAAAKQCGVSDRTVYRRMEDPGFKARLRDVRADMVRRSAGMLTAAAGEAIRALLALLKESAPPTVRLGAARAVLEIGIKVRELAELEAEMQELEERVKGSEGDRGQPYGRVTPSVGGEADPDAI